MKRPNLTANPKGWGSTPNLFYHSFFYCEIDFGVFFLYYALFLPSLVIHVNQRALQLKNKECKKTWLKLQPT